jgi:signal transduction histidine kinase
VLEQQQPITLSKKLQSLFKEEERELVSIRVRYTCYFTVSLFLIYYYLDKISFPDISPLLLDMRLFIAGFHILIYIVSYSDFGQKHPILLGVITYVSAGWMITAMCLMTGGHESRYYAGLLLVNIGCGIMMPWQARYSAIVAVLVNGVYLATILAFDQIVRIPVFVNINFFLWGTASICIITSNIWEGYRIREFLDKQKLKDLDRAKSNFFANISHELKTPMSMVLAPLENALADDKHSSELTVRRDDLDGVRRNAYRLSSLISDLLELSRGEIGKARLNPIDIQNTEAYFKGICDTVRPLIDKKEIEFTFDNISQQPVISHFFDPGKIDKVVVNLLSNAIRFTPKRGKVHFSVWDEYRLGYEAPVLMFEVRDSGVGIPENKLAQIFERFEQVDAHASGGMGIGLSIARDFVALHGGQIRVNSDEGRGSSFSVMLPRGRQYFMAPIIEELRSDIGLGIELPRVSESQWLMINQPVAQDKMLDINDSNKDLILLIEDSADMRQVLSSILCDEFRLLGAEDGAEGLVMAKKAKPDLIISDVMMPKMNGYELLAAVKADPATQDIPVVLLTAKSGDDSVEYGFSQGADDYIQKPFLPREVIARAKNLIQLRRQKERIEKQKEELKRINQTLQDAEAELVQGEKLSTIGLLAAGLAHEINNPAYSVTLSLANLEMIANEAKETQNLEMLSELKHYIERGHKEIDRIKKIIGTFLNYSRKNKEGITVQDISTNINDTLLLLNHLIKKNNVRIHWDEEKSYGLVEADHASLNQVFTNLIQNAIQAHSKNIWIDIEFHHSDFDLRVRDDGDGISMENQAHIFEAFYTTKEVGQGTGLGLNITHRVVLDHHGKIEVQSIMGQGTTFTVHLPASQTLGKEASKIA